MEYVDTRDVPIRDLTRFPGNARRGNIDRIRESIRATGQYRSIVVRDTGDALVILAGNHTHDAIKAEGHKTARCEIIRCDDTEARRINLADNRLAELGDYDFDALTELLSYLDGDYTGTGYSDEQVDALVHNVAAPNANEWETAFGNLPDGDKEHSSRTFNLRNDQAATVDEAMNLALKDVTEADGNRNAAALTLICEVFIGERTR